MPKFRIEKLDPDLAQAADVPGLAATVDLPDLPNPIRTWRALIIWFRNHPEIFAKLWKALQTLLGPGQTEDDQAA